MMSFYVGAMFAYLGGMALLLIAGSEFSVIFSACLLILSAIGVIAKRYKPVRLAETVFFLLGVILLSFQQEPCATVFDGYIDRYVELEGVVCEMPDEYDDYNSYIISLEKLVYLGEEKNIDEKIRITSEASLDVGNRAAFRGFIKTISAPDNSTEFDYRTYYKIKGITHKMHAEETELIDDRAFLLSPQYMSEYIKSRIGMAVDEFYSNDDAAMLKAVLLGNRTTFSKDFQKTLVRTSALRFLYPSYLHMFLLISLCQLIFTIIRPKYRERATVAAIFVFVLLNADFITFVRAGVLYLVDLFYRRLRGFSHYPDTISVVITASLIAEPLLIYNSGFVMSVIIGILLHLFRYPLASCFKKFIKNPYARTMLAICIIGTVGLAPLSAYFFNGMPLYSIIFTFVYTPLTVLLIITAPITLLLHELFGTASVVGLVTEGIIGLMKNLPEMAALLPGHYITLAKTSMLGFAILITICCALKLAVDYRVKEPIFKVTLSCVGLLMIAYTVIAFSDFGKLAVTFVNVGQGDAAIVEVKGKSTVLIDGGGGTADNEYNIGDEVYLPYLSSKGYNNIDLAIVSHCHRDHCEGIISAIESLDVHTVMLSDTAENNEYRDKVIAAAEANGTEILYVSAGDKLEFNSGLNIDVLYPQKAAVLDEENDYSLGLKLDYNGTALFFGGDMTEEAEEQILGRVGEIDVVKVSHHGSKTSSSAEFVAETSPDYAVISVGADNMYGHPAERVVNEYVNSGARVLRTDLMNDIVLKSEGGGKISAAWYGEELRWQ
ncbi:MAG: ComEC/Rec2 family competence protein [Clostridia bacterium]|nr:ComEC/Rec2 family competence protein [Clostridia bacterium]